MEKHLEDGWIFELEEDGSKVIYKSDVSGLGNTVITKHAGINNYYELETDTNDYYPKSYSSIEELCKKNRLQLPNSVKQELEGMIKENMMDFANLIKLFSDESNWGLEIILEENPKGFQVFSHLLNKDEWIEDSNIHKDWKLAIDEAILNLFEEDDMLFDLYFGKQHFADNEYAKYMLIKIEEKLKEIEGELEEMEESKSLKNISAKELNEELQKVLEDVEMVDSTIEDEINNAQPIDKDFEVSSHAFQIETGDYDYANIVRVEVEERVEKSDYNNPDKEASATETWIADGKEAVVVHFDTELDGPVRPSKIEIKDEHALYDILISLGGSTELFNNQV